MSCFRAAQHLSNKLKFIHQSSHGQYLKMNNGAVMTAG